VSSRPNFQRTAARKEAPSQCRTGPIEYVILLYDNHGGKEFAGNGGELTVIGKPESAIGCCRLLIESDCRGKGEGGASS